MAPLRPLAWLISLVLAGAVSYSTAALSMQVLGRRLDAGASLMVVAAPPPVAQARMERMTLADFQPVLADNIFGARRTEVKPGTGGAGGDAAQAAPVVKAPLVLTLTGTMIMGARAFAMIADANGRNEKVYRLYDCVPAGEDHPTRTCSPVQGKLVSVQRSKVLVTYQGERLTFEVGERPVPVAAAAPALPGRTSGLRRTVVEAPAAQSSNDAVAAPFPITQDGNVLQVRVPSAEVSKAFENFSDVLKEARVVPYTDANGNGFQIRNIRPGSIFDRIGLSNFDKIKAVNGDPITTADQALRLLTMFRNERELTLDLERKDQNLQLNYIIE
jgi:general secretion pathway protein C